MHSLNCSFVILGLTFFFTILSTIRLFSAKKSAATLLPEVPRLVPTLVVLLVLFIKLLAPVLVASLVPRLVPILVASFELSVASLSRQIVVMNSALKSISGARRQLVKEFFPLFAFCTKFNNISPPTSKSFPRSRWWRSTPGAYGRRWGGMSEGGIIPLRQSLQEK